jgi:hypothetical protein
MQREEDKMSNLKNLMRGQTFVEIRMVKEGAGEYSEEVQTRFTQTCDGNYPDWNETLSFDIIADDPSGFTENSLVQSNTTIYFSVFDRCMTSRKVGLSNKYETIIENKFLGSFSVGLVAVLQNFPKMEGLIRVNRPLDLQGYEMLTQGMYGFD